MKGYVKQGARRPQNSTKTDVVCYYDLEVNHFKMERTCTAVVGQNDNFMEVLATLKHCRPWWTAKDIPGGEGGWGVGVTKALTYLFGGIEG